jgi:hypothetical protein
MSQQIEPLSTDALDWLRLCESCCVDHGIEPTVTLVAVQREPPRDQGRTRYWEIIRLHIPHWRQYWFLTRMRWHLGASGQVVAEALIENTDPDAVLNAAGLLAAAEAIGMPRIEVSLARQASGHADDGTYRIRFYNPELLALPEVGVWDEGVGPGCIRLKNP